MKVKNSIISDLETCMRPYFFNHGNKKYKINTQIRYYNIGINKVTQNSDQFRS